MKSGRFDHQMIVLGHQVFAFGGRQTNDSSELNTVEIFNASTESWRLYPESLLSKATSGLALTPLPLSAVACNTGCKCGVQANARIIGGNNAEVKILSKMYFCKNLVHRLSLILGWASFLMVKRRTGDTVDVPPSL